MLNMVALVSDEDAPAPPRSSLVHPSFRWQFDTTFGMEEGILRYERDNMTMPLSSRGADPNGWRNALNYFGWGSMGAGVYRVSAYASFDAAAKSAVRSIARDHKPVGVLAWGGVHAQYVTGYEVRGEDPRVGDNYTVLGVFLTDPLAGGYAMDTFSRTWCGGTGRRTFASRRTRKPIRTSSIQSTVLLATASGAASRSSWRRSGRLGRSRFRRPRPRLARPRRSPESLPHGPAGGTSG